MKRQKYPFWRFLSPLFFAGFAMKTLLLIFYFPSGANTPIFKGTVTFLSAESAQKIWSGIQSRLQSMENLCQIQKETKKPQIIEWAKQAGELKKTAGDIYRENRYSFNGVKVKSAGKKRDLGLTLLDIQSVLSAEYIDYNVAKRDEKKACVGLKDGFVSAYSSHHNTPDNSDIIKGMAPWAGKIHSSLNCLCP